MGYLFSLASLSTTILLRKGNKEFNVRAELRQESLSSNFDARLAGSRPYKRWMAFGAPGVFTVPSRAIVITAGVGRYFDLERVDGSVMFVGALSSACTLQGEGEIGDSKLFA